MRTIKVTAALLSTLLLASCSASVVTIADSSNASAVSASAFYQQKPDWRSCGEPDFKNWLATEQAGLAECATVEAPLDYANLSGPKVELAIVKIPAINSTNTALVGISGGPGEGGLSLPFNYSDEVRAKLSEKFDLIGYDPRGVGRSTPSIQCTDNSAKEQQAGEQGARDFVANCVKLTGVEVLKHIGTREAVRDLDLIRSALGQDKLTALSYSYGTKVASQYAQQFPDRFQAMVPDGVVDTTEPDRTQLISQLKGFQATFERFTAYCSGLQGCPIAGDAKTSEQKFHDILNQLDVKPVLLNDGSEVDGGAALAETNNKLLWKDGWDGLIDYLQAATEGDAVGLAKAQDDAGPRQRGIFARASKKPIPLMR